MQSIIVNTVYKPNNSDFYYITIATKPNIVLNNLKKTVEKNGESIIVLGEKENRVIGWESKQNFGVKLKEVHNFIKNPDLNKRDIVLFTDAYDIAYFGNKNEIIKRFKNLNMPIIFGCEKYCFPDPHLKTNYFIRDKEFPYLNSGMFIGYVEDLRKCIGNYSYNDSDDDQRFWTNEFFKYPGIIGLDYNNDLFLNMHDIEMQDFSFENKTVLYKNRNPLFIHVNGPDKTMIYDFLTHEIKLNNVF